MIYYSRSNGNYIRKTHLISVFFLYLILFFIISNGHTQQSEIITPTQAKEMIVRFLTSSEAAKLELKTEDTTYGPYIDPLDNKIRWCDWCIDPIKETILEPYFNGYQIEGSFGIINNKYTITDIRKVNITRISFDDAKSMIIGFLSSSQAANLPQWVSESQKNIEKTKSFTLYPGGKMIVGTWLIDPYLKTVILPVNNAELHGTFQKEGKYYNINNIVIKEVQRIQPSEVIPMILRFLATKDAKIISQDIKYHSRNLENNKVSISNLDFQSLWPDSCKILLLPSWKINPLTHYFEYRDVNITWYGRFVKENNIYIMVLQKQLLDRNM